MPVRETQDYFIREALDNRPTPMKGRRGGGGVKVGYKDVSGVVEGAGG